MATIIGLTKPHMNKVGIWEMVNDHGWCTRLGVEWIKANHFLHLHLHMGMESGLHPGCIC